MHGFLDHLEASRGHALPSLLHAPRQNWTRRFARLNDAFSTLELFADASLQQRVSRLELAHAEVATADELGELLFSKPTTKIPIQLSRRFVFRVVVHSASASHADVHYFCAEQKTEDDDADEGRVDVAASRTWMDQWVHALRATVRHASASSTTVVAPVDQRDVHTKLAAFVDELFVAAHVTARHVDADDPHKHGQYEVTVHAWTLQRELVPLEDDEQEKTQWQVLEYASVWRVLKTSTQLRDLDAQLRQRGVSDDLRDLPPPPSFSGVRAFLHSRVHDPEEENTHRVLNVDAYWQSLLRLPAFSVFGSDASAMLDGFLEISRHLARFKRLEKATGQSFHLRSRRIVPWRERETFEKLFEIHQAMVRAEEETRRKLRQSRQAQHPPEKKHHHHHHHSTRRGSEVAVGETSPVETVDHDPAETGGSVRERIARIGHKLLVEAFVAPAPPAQET